MSDPSHLIDHRAVGPRNSATKTARMNHRISAGVIVEQDNRVLLVRHKRPGVYDFWAAPGGGAQGSEELAQAACREVREETGLVVHPGPMLYIEEFHSPETRHCKFWFKGLQVSGALSTAAPEAVSEYIVEAAWLTRTELESRQVFPEVLVRQYWQDRQQGFAAPRYLGLRKMEFW